MELVLPPVVCHIVQLQPEIPQNTGTIGRMCVSTNTPLHLIHPMCFEINDKNVKRAGLDYWPHLELHEYENFEDYLQKANPAKMLFFSTKGKVNFWDAEMPLGAHLIFGSESKGFPAEIYEKYADQLVTIPMNGVFHRSLNVANSASIALYEALRRHRNIVF